MGDSLNSALKDEVASPDGAGLSSFVQVADDFVNNVYIDIIDN